MWELLLLASLTLIPPMLVAVLGPACLVTRWFLSTVPLGPHVQAAVLQDQSLPWLVLLGDGSGAPLGPYGSGALRERADGYIQWLQQLVAWEAAPQHLPGCSK